MRLWATPPGTRERKDRDGLNVSREETVEKMGELKVEEDRRRGRLPTKKWLEVVRDDMRTRGVDPQMVSDWGGWRRYV